VAALPRGEMRFAVKFPSFQISKLPMFFPFSPHRLQPNGKLESWKVGQRTRVAKHHPYTPKQRAAAEQSRSNYGRGGGRRSNLWVGRT
jgi:hypothetical protein